MCLQALMPTKLTIRRTMGEIICKRPHLGPFAQKFTGDLRPKRLDAYSPKVAPPIRHKACSCPSHTGRRQNAQARFHLP